MKTIYIMRGIPGTGKTTKAKEIAKKTNGVICSADNFFEKDGVYNYDSRLISKAHEQCFNKFLKYLDDDSVDSIIIDNTNLTHNIYAKYVKEAEDRNYAVQIAYPDSPLAYKIKQYALCTDEEKALKLESEIVDELEKTTHRSGNFTRNIPRHVLTSMLQMFEYP